MRIAIVDDNLSFARDVEVLIKRICTESNEAVFLQMFCDGNELYRMVKNGVEFDLFFLDVEMPNMDGLTLAKLLMEKNNGAKIVYITSYEKYAFKSIKLGAYYYILKSEYKDELPRLLKRIYREYKANGEEYVIKDGNKMTRVKVKEIRYLTKDSKYTIFHYEGREISERISLEEACKRLPKDKFVFIGRGLVISVTHVVNIQGHKVEITGGEQFRISRFYYPNAMEIITNYLGLT